MEASGLTVAFAADVWRQSQTRSSRGSLSSPKPLPDHSAQWLVPPSPYSERAPARPSSQHIPKPPSSPRRTDTATSACSVSVSSCGRAGLVRDAAIARHRHHEIAPRFFDAPRLTVSTRTSPPPPTGATEGTSFQSEASPALRYAVAGVVTLSSRAAKRSAGTPSASGSTRR